VSEFRKPVYFAVVAIVTTATTAAALHSAHPALIGGALVRVAPNAGGDSCQSIIGSSQWHRLAHGTQRPLVIIGVGADGCGFVLGDALTTNGTRQLV
jgi:hypothetical protein